MDACTNLKIGLIGGGKMAQHHARAIARIPYTQLTAVVDRDSGTWGTIQQVAPTAKGFGSIEEMLRTEVPDIVHVCTPPATHEELARKALDAGCHIYVEKPFVLTVQAARSILQFARERGLKACAGHQLLYEPPTRAALRLLPALGKLVHIESYFSFRTVRRTPGGRAPLRPDLQLLDILPHPVYLLLEFLEAAPGTVELTGLDVGQAGTVHALVRKGDLTGSLTVTLEGRPVESYLRLVGTNGSVHADYVRGILLRHIGPGTSGIDKLFAPYRQSWQTASNTTSSMAKRVLRRQRSYPGLVELFAAFYESVRTNRPSPVSAESIEETVKLCEHIGRTMAEAETRASVNVCSDPTRPRSVVTGGTGFLGKGICRQLLARGWKVRVLARRTPAPWEKIDGVEYLTVDLGGEVDPVVLEDCDVIIHAAAETAGGWDDHQRNSIAATEHLITAAAAARVTRFIHVSSLAVLDASVSTIRDDSPLAPDSRKQGPYVWGKLESERMAEDLGRRLKIAVKTVRPGALVDYGSFEPPGRLGKRLGNWFLAVGSPRHRLGIVDVDFASAAIAWIASHFEQAPGHINLLAPSLPTKRELLNELKKTNPDLSVVWLPTLLLMPLSWTATLLQKLLRPGKPAINVARVFAVQKYDTTLISSLARSIAADTQVPSGATKHPATVNLPG